jgi:hypothetical protein
MLLHVSATPFSLLSASSRYRRFTLVVFSYAPDFPAIL